MSRPFTTDDVLAGLEEIISQAGNLGSHRLILIAARAVEEINRLKAFETHDADESRTDSVQ